MEAKNRKPELERQRINKEWLMLAEALEFEKMKLQNEVEELLEYRREMDERCLIRDLMYCTSRKLKLFLMSTSAKLKDWNA